MPIRPQLLPVHCAKQGGHTKALAYRPPRMCSEVLCAFKEVFARCSMLCIVCCIRFFPNALQTVMGCARGVPQFRKNLGPPGLRDSGHTELGRNSELQKFPDAAEGGEPKISRLGMKFICGRNRLPHLIHLYLICQLPSGSAPYTMGG
jgi:hypothetical protein